jgi:hypothetical protein
MRRVGVELGAGDALCVVLGWSWVPRTCRVSDTSCRVEVGAVDAC